MGLELDVEPELLPLPELPVLFFRKVAYGLELSCGEEDIPARNGEDRGELGRILIIHRTLRYLCGTGHPWPSVTIFDCSPSA